LKAVTTEQLTDNGEYEEILEDMRDECRKFGMHVVECVMLLGLFLLKAVHLNITFSLV
jgi:hypothetical protein